MENLTEYGEHELSNWVFNTECLYNARNDMAGLMQIIDNIFIYTDKQLLKVGSDIAAECY